MTTQSRLAVALVLSAAIAAGGCGTKHDCGSTTVTPGQGDVNCAADQSHSLTTTEPGVIARRTTATSTTSPPGRTFNAHAIDVTAGNFALTLDASLTLGRAATNTDGQSPPFVNVEAPVHGRLVITNDTNGYDVDPQNVPLIGLFLLYPTTSAMCDLGSASAFHPGRADLCAIDIAEFAASCETAPLSIPQNDTAELVPWAQFELSELQAGAPSQCANVNDLQPPDTVRFTRLTSTTGGEVADQLNGRPKYWALVLENGSLQTGVDPATGAGPSCESDEFYVQGGQYIGETVFDTSHSAQDNCLGK